MSVLAAENIGLTLGGVRVLDDVSALFRRGRVTALLGPNGAGKTTLLSCLAGLRVPDSGAATLDGKDVRSIDRGERARRIGMLTQAGDIHWNVDARTLVGLGRLPHRGRGGETAQDRAAIDRAMAVTDTTIFARRGVEHLSGGERGRVLLARVLAGEPEWLLADEPLASLDPAHQLDVLALLRAVADAGKGVVLVIHDLQLAAQIADDIILLRAGKLIAAGEADAMLTPELIGETYGIEIESGRTPLGHRFLLPISRR